MKIIVYAPHVCIVSQSMDSGCDFHSKMYAEIFSNTLNGKLITSQITREECDNNRNNCRSTSSRTQLRDSISNNTFVLEIHTFDSQVSSWRRYHSTEPEVVILAMGNWRDSQRIANLLRGNGIDAIVLQGGDVNDIQREVKELDEDGMLIELSQTLTRDQIRKIARVFK